MSLPAASAALAWSVADEAAPPARRPNVLTRFRRDRRRRNARRIAASALSALHREPARLPPLGSASGDAARLRDALVAEVRSGLSPIAAWLLSALIEWVVARLIARLLTDARGSAVAVRESLRRGARRVSRVQPPESAR
ncbi:hypothetical protein [Alienimonas sp. DA493]|uniref:hypothetical protein n=1 Tax=Alienimonas sp. DA493 TaxID=3373605 RepID=UPI003754DD77